MDIRVGTRVRRTGFCIDKSADPNLTVGEVVWLEQKEPDLMRPLSRERWRVAERLDEGDSVIYQFEKP